MRKVIEALIADLSKTFWIWGLNSINIHCFEYISVFFWFCSVGIMVVSFYYAHRNGGILEQWLGLFVKEF